ncbi:hypothetical protein [Streptomyces sp. NPDC097619]|uniref:hypothetical protein n=1 Tax=Streptomyces sp. NPDC097619 TaxID=3157228 RepID=UPI0033319F13
MNAPARTGPADRAPAPGAAPRAALDVTVHHYEEAKAPLLRDTVLPLARRAEAAGLGAHVERHWRYGPHLRLCLEGPPGPVAEAAERAAAELRARVAARPSRSPLTEAELLTRAAAAGRAELIAPPYGPLVPDNTVRVTPADPAATAALTALIGAEGVRLRTALLRTGLAALAAGTGRLGERGDSATARVGLAVTALAAHASAHPGGLIGGHYSYVSHLEDFLVHEPDSGQALRAGFDRQWESAGPQVTDLVGRVSGGGATGWERAWADWSADAWRRIADRHAAGADLGGNPEEYRARAAALGDPATADRWDPDRRTRFSPFHRLLDRAEPDGGLWRRPEYLIHRTATNALYRLLALCDVRPLERYLAAHLLVRAVPGLTGYDWRERLAAAAERAERVS